MLFRRMSSVTESTARNEPKSRVNPRTDSTGPTAPGQSRAQHLVVRIGVQIVFHDPAMPRTGHPPARRPGRQARPPAPGCPRWQSCRHHRAPAGKLLAFAADGGHSARRRWPRRPAADPAPSGSQPMTAPRRATDLFHANTSTCNRHGRHHIRSFAFRFSLVRKHEDIGRRPANLFPRHIDA